MDDKRCTLVNNSDREDAKVILLTSGTTYNDLLKLGTGKFGFKVKKFYWKDGSEVHDISNIRDDDVIYVSAGEPYANKNMKEKCPLYSIAIMGPGAVGKSAMTMQYVQGVFVVDYDPTIEDAYRKNTTVDDKPCMLDILDTAGQEDFTALRSIWMRERDGFILVFSVIDTTSFGGLQPFYEQLSVMHEDEMPPLLLVGNKSDMENQRQVSPDEATKKAEEYGCKYIETSAKTGKNIDEVFEEMVKEIRKRVPQNDGNSPSGRPKPRFCTLL